VHIVHALIVTSLRVARHLTMISAILLYNQKGEVLISRLYRDGLRRSIADVFRIQVISNPEVSTEGRRIGAPN
jgi:AP-2 complex subunit mu-1